MASTTGEVREKSPKNSSKTANKLVTLYQSIYRPLGFQKGYNFPLFIIFGGAMLGFVFARVMYLNISGSSKTSFKTNTVPGEWYWYQHGFRRIGITLHLATCLPLGFLMVWQFLPVIRHELLLFHRINGYICILLVILTNIGSLMIGRHAFGGGLDVQLGVGILAIITIGSIGMAYYNVKRLRIDQHRAWMLRGVFYLGTIITLRLILKTSAPIVTMLGTYYQSQPCAQVEFGYATYGLGAYTEKIYPQCLDSQAWVSAKADMNGPGPENIEAALSVSFGLSFWLALFLHMVGVEVYLALTPKEGERLRNVSLERQLELGLKTREVPG